MPTRGVRGAICAKENTKEAIERATHELLCAMLAANPSLETGDLASAVFTMTEDLDATYPALAARQVGWHEVPLLCAREINVPGSLGRCIRVLLHWNTEIPQGEIRHVYLGEAVVLRPDIANRLVKTAEGAVK